MASFIFLLSTAFSRILSTYFGTHSTSLHIIQQKGEILYQHGQYEQVYRLVTGMQDLQRQHWDKNQTREQYHRLQQLCFRYRLQCLVQLGKYQQALQLCKLIVKCYPNCNWYLVSYDYMEPPLDKAWQLFRQCYMFLFNDNELHWHQVVRQVTPVQVTSYFYLDLVLVLPCEVVHSIFALLPLDSLVRCSRVSHTWRKLLLSTPLLWQHLYFDGSLSANTVDLYLSRLQGAPLTSLHINCDLDAETLLSSLCNSNCTQLQVLDLTRLHCVNRNGWLLFQKVIYSTGKAFKKLKLGSSSFKLDDIMDLVSKACPQLELLDLRDCFTSQTILPLDGLASLEHICESLPITINNYVEHLPILGLRQLELSDIHGLTIIHLASILLRSPCLVDLTLRNCLVNIIPIVNVLRHCCPDLANFVYHRNQLGRNPIIEHNPIHSSVSPTLPLTMMIQPTTSSNDRIHSGLLQSWKKLSLIQTRALTNDLLHYVLFGSYHTIQSLDLTGSLGLTDECLFNMIPSSLEECKLAGCMNITTLGLCSFLQNTPHLRILDVSGLSGVTDMVLLSIALHCRRLVKLNLTLCRSITDTGLQLFIDTLDSPLQELGLARTNLTTPSLTYAMCHIQRDDI
ncbi:uncharacterized protein BX664DRAFT_336586 [Halteromyces radiatus]|uniref:uncharacterized protein n=1 Tax=Halteromyces radiatus TaxID=101107 RepID=UPI00221F9C4C|nr:uncharacterized protein BX664DRAFT_336586 [Halteromyces radiatus]KAI8086714.1 hypothetical protein BX664DRAFT_336586 [Halteromyces radiatus]